MKRRKLTLEGGTGEAESFRAGQKWDGPGWVGWGGCVVELGKFCTGNLDDMAGNTSPSQA
jgi:hypothetical protein